MSKSSGRPLVGTPAASEARLRADVKVCNCGGDARVTEGVVHPVAPQSAAAAGIQRLLLLLLLLHSALLLLVVARARGQTGRGENGGKGMGRGAPGSIRQVVQEQTS